MSNTPGGGPLGAHPPSTPSGRRAPYCPESRQGWGLGNSRREAQWLCLVKEDKAGNISTRQQPPRSECKQQRGGLEDAASSLKEYEEDRLLDHEVTMEELDEAEKVWEGH